MGDVDSLYVKIDNLNDMLVEFCFIRSIDISRVLYSNIISLFKFSKESFNIFFHPF
jgi:hypothetical protein